jgi:signal peptidase II
MAAAEKQMGAGRPSRGPSEPGKARYLLLALAVLALDQWTKWWVEVTLDLYEVVRVVPGLNLTRIENTGIAFGLFPAGGSVWGTALLMALGFGALTIVSIFFWRARRSERWLLAGLGLVMGGAVGNLVDRAMTGAVTDFVDFYVGSYHWHTFNVADSAISIGIVMLLLESVFDHRTKTAPSEPVAADGD